MISDVLSDATMEIKRYLNEFPSVYDDKMTDRIRSLLAKMEDVRTELDKAPPM